MRLSTAATLTAGVATAHAFKDTSPFLLFSSSSLPSSVTPFSTSQLQPAADVLKSTKEFLATCPSDIYIIISQPSLSASDLSPQTSIPMLRKTMADSSVQTLAHVAEVVGLDAGLQARKLYDTIIEQCGANSEIGSHFFEGYGNPDGWNIFAEGKKVVVMSSFEPLTGSKRERDLANNDAGLYREFLEELVQGHKYTVIYTTSPVPDVIEESYVYDPEFQDVVHMDLKRNVFQTRANSTRDPRPLFEKYNFLSPGLFMGLLTSFILISILGVGVKALGSLQVSYGAFEKEMGPAAQKKAQ